MGERQHERQHRILIGDADRSAHHDAPTGHLRGARVMGLFWPMVRGVVKGAVIFAALGCGFAYWMGWASFGLADDARLACRRITAGESYAEARAAAQSRVVAPTRLLDHDGSFQIVAHDPAYKRPARCEVQANRGKVLHATYRPGE